MTAKKASPSPVCFFLLAFLARTSSINVANVKLCRFNSTDYVVALHSTGEAVCCRERVCPPGHYAEPCSSDNPETSICHLCSPGTFQPRPNLLGTKCIKKKSCDGSCTKYNHQGTSTEDAECECKQGCYWDEYSSSCKNNILCPPGYGIDDKGGCTECNHGTFSDTYDNLEKCRPHTKCYMFNRCIQIPGNTTDDNVCCDQTQAGIVSAIPIENGDTFLHVLMVFQAVFLTIVAGVVISVHIFFIKYIKKSEHTEAKILQPVATADDYIPIRGIDCKCEFSLSKGTSCSDETNDQHRLDVADSQNTPCSTTGTNTLPWMATNEATCSLKTPCSTTGTNTLPWADTSEAAKEPRVSQEEEAYDITNVNILPNEDEAKLPVTKTIDESLRCTTVIPMSIPERLKENLLQLNFVDMFGFGKDSFQVYVCSKLFGKHTEPEVKKIIKSLAKAHGIDCDCDVIVSATPKRLSFMCGKKPSRPGAKIVRKGNDEDRFGSLGGYFRTSEVDSPVYVITSEHVANKGVDVRVIQSRDAVTEDTCTEVHYGTCQWAIETGSTPSRFVDIAAIEVPTLGWRPGIEGGPGESVFNGNIQSVIGKLVYKYGAQTDITCGEVTGCNFVIRGEDGKSSFQGVVLVEGKSEVFCAGGDSGSFVRLSDSHEPLAMVVGGVSNDREPATCACYPLQSSLEELGNMSNKMWILEDEANLQCLLQVQGGYSNLC